MTIPQINWFMTWPAEAQELSFYQVESFGKWSKTSQRERPTKRIISYVVGTYDQEESGSRGFVSDPSGCGRVVPYVLDGERIKGPEFIEFEKMVLGSRLSTRNMRIAALVLDTNMGDLPNLLKIIAAKDELRSVGIKEVLE